jgi:hypothetical protein
MSCYAASSVELLPTFWDKLSVPFTFQESFLKEPMGSPETSVKITIPLCEITQKSAALICSAAEA